MTKHEKHIERIHRNWEYQLKWKKFMKHNRICIFCLFFFKIIHPSQIVHHSKGRKYHYLNEATWIPVCKWADKVIHEKSNKQIMNETGFYIPHL